MTFSLYRMQFVRFVYFGQSVGIAGFEIIGCSRCTDLELGPVPNGRFHDHYRTRGEKYFFVKSLLLAANGRNFTRVR